jgi:CRISPR-associated protein Cas6
VAKIDIVFRVTGERIPADHGYRLYSAICGLVPALHAPEATADTIAYGDGLWKEVGIHPINARPCGGRMLMLQSDSSIRIRIDESRMESVVPLAGKELWLGDCAIRLGAPRVDFLRPAVRLRSRIVVIKGFLEAEPFLAAVSRQLEALGIAARPGIPIRKQPPTPVENKSPLLRRTIQIRDKVVAGYSVEVAELTADESIRLQEAGIGGRRRFGCGLFLPVD